MAKTYGDRVIAVGEAAGQVQTTTGGGIYYGLLGAEVAGEVVGAALRRRDVSGQSLREHDRLWKRLMAEEIKLGYWARRVASRLSDSQIERLVRAVQGDGFFTFAERHARFDWQRELISYFLQMSSTRDVLFRPDGL